MKSCIKKIFANIIKKTYDCIKKKAHMLGLFCFYFFLLFFQIDLLKNNLKSKPCLLERGLTTTESSF